MSHPRSLRAHQRCLADLVNAIGLGQATGITDILAAVTPGGGKLAQWLIYPSVDFLSQTPSLAEFAQGYLLTRQDMDFFHGHYLPNPADRGDIRASPLHASSLAGQPPALVFTCGLDPLRDQGRAYAAMLIEHGVSVRFREAAGQVHGCFNLRQAIPSAHRDLLGCLADLRGLIREAQTEATMM